MSFRFHLLVFVLIALFGVWACSDPAKKLPEYNLVPAFEMTDSQGRTFHSRELAGKIWVADFIYTHCPGPCPRMTSQMHSLEKKLEANDNVRLVSISVDPDRDTPPVLQEFAHRFGGPTPHWFFLTGKPETIHRLAREVFMVGDLIGVMDHSTKFAIVDRTGHIRGYYSSFDKEALDKLIADIQILARSGR